MPIDAIVPLPVRVEAFDDESGMSHVLRAFRANGVPFRRGLEWLRVPAGKHPRDVDARALAWAVRAPPHWLVERLFVTPGRGEGGWHKFAAQRLSGTASMVGRSARQCPACVQQSGYCRLSWALRSAPGCARHATLLVDACVHCKQRLAWNRPAVDVCVCGRYFELMGSTAALPAVVVDWVRWVEHRLGLDIPADDVRCSASVPKLLDQLSLDGAWRLVEAFGPASQGSTDFVQLIWSDSSEKGIAHEQLSASQSTQAV